jgi:hypothetical protein
MYFLGDDSSEKQCKRPSYPLFIHQAVAQLTFLFPATQIEAVNTQHRPSALLSALGHHHHHYHHHKPVHEPPHTAHRTPQPQTSNLRPQAPASQTP